MNKGKAFCWLFAVLGCTTKLCADTSGTPETIAIHNLRMAMSAFEKIHGFSATNWGQVGEFIHLDRLNQQSLIHSSAYPIQRHYVFVKDKIPMLGSDEGEVLLIRTDPVTNISGIEGRYIISKNADGPKFNWYQEDKVKKMLADAGVAELPEPESLNQPTNTSEALPLRKTSNAPTTNITVRTNAKAESVAVAPAITQPAAEPSSASVETPTTPQPASAADSSSFTKKFVALLAVVLGLAAAFVLLRSKK